MKIKPYIDKNSTQKVDHEQKCKGALPFVDDILIDEVLYAKTIRSTIAKGKIVDIVLPKLPDGYYYVDKNDVVKENVVNMIFSDWPVFPDGCVNYIGEPIMLVVGPKKDVLENISKQIIIKYKEETPVFDYSDSYIHKSYKKGDYDKARSEAKHIINETFETGYQEQAYLEPQGMLVYLEDDNKVVLTGSMQCPYYIKNAVMRTLGYDADHVRVIQPSVGGAFGGKEDYPSVLACQLATAIIKIRKPIKLIFEREEDMVVTTKRHPSKTVMEALIDKDNKISGIKARVYLDGGAYKGLSGVVLSRSLIAITNAYTIDNLDVVGDVYRTNTVPNGAFRGFGSPQTIFAIEMFVHHIAKKIGVDPLSLRMNQLVKQGDVTANSGHFHDPIILKDMIDRAMVLSDYKRKISEYSKPGSNKGIGMSFFLHGCGFTGSGESDHIKAKVKLIKDELGHVNVYAASVDMGQGNKTTLKRIVAMNLEIPNEQVTFNNPDTDVVPDSGPTAASRTIIIVGYLMEKAAKRLKEQWQDGKRQEIIENYVGPDYIHWDEATLQGDAYPSYSWGVNVVEVECNPLTYQVDIKGVWSVYDVGKTIDERISMGQADGGVVQGIGYGYIESMYHSDGKIRQKNLTDYIIPTTEDIPEMETEFMDNPFKFGPSGAKGLGELSLVGGAPAVALAIENAINKPVNKIPANPEYIMELVNDGKN